VSRKHENAIETGS